MVVWRVVERSENSGTAVQTEKLSDKINDGDQLRKEEDMVDKAGPSVIIRHDSFFKAFYGGVGSKIVELKSYTRV